MLLFFVLFSIYNCFSQENFSEIDLYGNNGEGVEFVFSSPMPFTNSTVTSQLTLFSKYDTKVIIESNNFNKTINLSSNKVSIININSFAIAKQFNQTQMLAQKSEVIKNAGVRLTAEKPFKAMLLVYSENNSEATYLLPYSFCDTSYVLQSFSGLNYNSNILSPISTITSFADSTEVEVKMGGVNTSRLFFDNDTLNFGEKKKFILNRHDILILQNFRDNDFELAGTQITSNKKISILNGNYCSNVPNNTPPCNFMLEVGLPTKYYGKKFYIPSFKDRFYSGLIRVFTIDNTTKIYEDGKQILSLTNSTPGLKNRSWADYRINNKSSDKKYSVITSDQPISVLYISPSSNDDNSQYKSGMFSILPAELMSKESINPESLFNKFDSVKINNSMIVPLKNGIISNEILINNNEWKEFKKLNLNYTLYDTDYSIIDKIETNYTSIWSQEPHQLYTIGHISDNNKKYNFTITEYGNLRNQRLFDVKTPWMTFVRRSIIDSKSGEVELNFTLNDERSDLYRYLIFENEIAVLDSFLISSNTRKIELSHTFTAKDNQNYKCLAIDNSNNFQWFDLGILYKKEVELDTISIGRDYIIFDLIQVGDSSQLTIPLKLISQNPTQITSIEIEDGNNIFNISNTLTLPLNLEKNKDINLTINYTPTTEYTKSEYQDKYGFGDYANLNISTTNGTFTYIIYGKAGIARMYWRYDNNSFIDTLSQGSEHQIKDNRFFIQNYNLSTKENGTYDLIIDKINLDSIYNVNFDKVHFKNIQFSNRLAINEDGTFVNPLIIKPGEKLFLNDEIKFVGDEPGSFSFYLPFYTNAINGKEFGIIYFEFVVFEKSTSIRNVGEIKFTLQNGFLTFSPKNEKVKTITIFDLNGKEIHQSNNINLKPIDLTSYRNQILIYRIITQNNVFQGKILVN